MHVVELGCDSVVTHSVGIGCALETASVGGIWSLGADKVPQDVNPQQEWPIQGAGGVGEHLRKEKTSSCRMGTGGVTTGEP